MHEGKRMNKDLIIEQLKAAEARGDVELARLIKSQLKDMGMDAGVVGTIGRNKRAIYVHA